MRAWNALPIQADERTGVVVLAAATFTCSLAPLESRDPFQAALLKLIPSQI